MQVIYPISADGSSGKLSASRIATTSQGYWLLPFWRERSGSQGCRGGPAGATYAGVPGVLQSADQVSCP